MNHFVLVPEIYYFGDAAVWKENAILIVLHNMALYLGQTK